MSDKIHKSITIEELELSEDELKKFSDGSRFLFGDESEKKDGALSTYDPETSSQEVGKGKVRAKGGILS